MPTIEEVERVVLDDIQSVYKRPGMYGTTPREIEAVLWCYHRIAAVVRDQLEQLYRLQKAIHERENYGPCDALGHYEEVSRHGEYDKAQAYNVVFTFWKEIDEALGIAAHAQS